MNLGWRVAPLTELVAVIEDQAWPRHRPVWPFVVGIDGHSSSGKTTLAARLAAALPDASVLHTDDLAWHQGVFGWDGLLVGAVLPVVRAGDALDYRPPQWELRGRTDTIELPPTRRFLIVEGVGASQPSLAAEVDFVIWVETDEPTRSARDAVRLAGGEMSAAGFRDWMAEENAYVVGHRPWLHANRLTNGGDSIGYDRQTEVVVGIARSQGTEGSTPPAPPNRPPSSAGPAAASR